MSSLLSYFVTKPPLPPAKTFNRVPLDEDDIEDDWVPINGRDVPLAAGINITAAWKEAHEVARQADLAVKVALCTAAAAAGVGAGVVGVVGVVVVVVVVVVFGCTHCCSVLKMHAAVSLNVFGFIKYYSCVNLCQLSTKCLNSIIHL